MRGLAGWQWMFTAEAVPTVPVGIFLLLCVTDRPQLAHWLSDEERTWLTVTLETERRRVEAKRKISPWESFWHPKVLWLALNYFCVVTESVGMLLFLPKIIKQLEGRLGHDDCISVRGHRHAGGWVSDRLAERRRTLSLASSVSAAGLVSIRSDRHLDIRHRGGRKALLSWRA